MRKFWTALLLWLLTVTTTQAKEIWLASAGLSEYSRSDLLALLEGRISQGRGSESVTLVVYLDNQEITRRFIEDYLELNYFRTLVRMREQVNSGRASALLDVPGKDDAYVAVFTLDNSMTYSDDSLEQLRAIGLSVVDVQKR
jgi:hypothetical protein